MARLLVAAVGILYSDCSYKAEDIEGDAVLRGAVLRGASCRSAGALSLRRC